MLPLCPECPKASPSLPEREQTQGCLAAKLTHQALADVIALALTPVGYMGTPQQVRLSGFWGKHTDLDGYRSE